MNRDQTIALWEEAQASDNPAEVWNTWANGLLEEKKEYERKGTWKQHKEEWRKRAIVDFRDCSFRGKNVVDKKTCF